jgi:hypothetical protein
MLAICIVGSKMSTLGPKFGVLPEGPPPHVAVVVQLAGQLPQPEAVEASNVPLLPLLLLLPPPDEVEPASCCPPPSVPPLPVLPPPLAPLAPVIPEPEPEPPAVPLLALPLPPSDVTGLLPVPDEHAAATTVARETMIDLRIIDTDADEQSGLSIAVLFVYSKGVMLVERTVRYRSSSTAALEECAGGRADPAPHTVTMTATEGDGARRSA